MRDADHGRRRFIVGAATVAGAAITLGPSAIIGIRAWAQGAPGDESRAVLAQVARLLYPHAAISDEVYAEVMDQAMSMVADDTQFDQLLREAGDALEEDTAQTFADASPAAQLTALQAVENQPYFGAVLGAVANRLYSHPRLWEMIGYEGPSFAKGGYLHRGSGDIDWLPEAGP